MLDFHGQEMRCLVGTILRWVLVRRNMISLGVVGNCRDRAGPSASLGWLKRVFTQLDHQALTPALMVVRFSRQMACIPELSCMERHVKMELIPGYCCIQSSGSESPDKVLTCTNTFLSFTRATSWYAILCRCRCHQSLRDHA